MPDALCFGVFRIRALYELYLEPKLVEMCKKMAGMTLKEARKQAYKKQDNESSC